MRLSPSEKFLHKSHLKAVEKQWIIYYNILYMYEQPKTNDYSYKFIPFFYVEWLKGTMPSHALPFCQL